MTNSTLQQASQVTSTVDRVQASKLLKVSVRTIDRYIKNGRLAAYQKNGRIWLKRSDVIEMGKGSLVMKSTGIIENHSPIRGTGARTAPSVQEINAAIQSAQPLEATESNFYKDLYEEAQKRLNDSQHKLEQSTQRMGDLEAHLMRVNNQSINQASQPMVTKQIERIEVSKEERFEIEMLKKELQEKDKNHSELKALYENEKSNKNVFAILTYILLSLQPIFWYFLK